MTAPDSTVVVPGAPIPRRPRGFAVGVVLGLLATVGVVVAEKAGTLPHLSGGSSADSSDDAEDVPFTDPDRLQTALDAAVDQAGSSRAAQLVVGDGDVSVVLFDPTSQVWTRYQEYDFDVPGDG